ncbi:MAG: molybdopterin molybdotransferase [Solirubrobacteraceae bacterium]|jgi:molybdopterin molybdotransferase|nr:molybdopterin molybdotransferase [Solirubrobacteraceae bacterium]
MSVLISLARASAIVADAVPVPRRKPDLLGFDDALHRVLAHDLLAAGDVPPFPNSAMDGYAVAPGPAGRRLPVVDEARAGRPATSPLRDGEAIRISTGAALPSGAQAVVRREDTDEQDGLVTVEVEVASGQNVRRAGEDLRRGEVVLGAGADLRPAELALAVAAGASGLPCAPRPRVAVLCTGDELRAPGAALGLGEIHNSNAVGLAAAARRAGGEVVLAGGVGDTLQATTEALADALERADVVVVSGGVSVGAHDHVKPALASLGVAERFWGVALKPGKPTWFGLRGEQPVFGLPGNPVSAMVTFRLFVTPALRALQGAEPEPQPLSAALAVAVSRERREQAVRVLLSSEAPSGLRATPTGPQGSHLLSSLAGADGLALIPAGTGELAAGEAVRVLRT